MPLLSPILPQPHQPIVKWGKLYGAAAALAIAEAAAEAPGPLIVIAQNSRDAESLSDEIRFFAGASLGTRVFPDLETLPYDSFSAHPDITSARLATLAELPRARRGVWLVAVDTLLQRLAPRSFIEAYSLKVHVGESLDLGALRAQLALAGYAAVTQVVAHGEFAVRGSLIDVFPMGSDIPYRIDMLDRDVDSIRRFDPDTQRSLDKLDRIQLLPARETPLNPEAVREFRRRYRLRFSGDLSEQAIYRDVSAGIASGGIEYFLPLFFDRTSHLFEYLPPDSVLVDVNDAASAVQGLWNGIVQRHEQLRHDRHRPILDPAEVYLTPAEFLAAYGGPRQIQLRTFEWPPETEGPTQNFPSVAPSTVRVAARVGEPAAELVSHIRASSARILLAAESAGRRELLLDLLRGGGIQAEIFDGFSSFVAGTLNLGITVSAAVSGLRLEAPPLEILTEAQLFGDRARQERRRRRAERDPAKILKELSDLRIGAPVVHESYGVGRYAGLKTMDVAGYTGEFLVLEYADGDKLYVPVQALHLVSRYTGAPADSAPLHKLGGEQWQKARRKAAQRIRDVAAELLDLYSRRAARQGTQMDVGEGEYRAFQAGFPFEETADQAVAIEQVLGDLKSDKPMDRVICGDVGFGKTEVALRAAFVAVQAGKQVAVLVPTTLLAQQHYTDLRRPLCGLAGPHRKPVALPQQQGSRRTLAGVAAGTVDIVIATQRLLQGKVRFKDLGLVVIDEEHRFGVRDKEKLKALRAEVDVLTLTATPIPRTLNMAMGGLRDLSLITTPPAERLAVKTFVLEWNETVVREASLREIRRGGQIYFVHNTIDTIEKTAQAIRELVPEANVARRSRSDARTRPGTAHARFLSPALQCTGVHDHHRERHRRTDRQHHRHRPRGSIRPGANPSITRPRRPVASPCLCLPDHAAAQAMTADAVKRLEALESLEELGAGFTLATHDLEIRGAGELLGDEQSGQIEEIGYNLYMELLERAVAALKSGKQPDLDRPLDAGPEVELHLPVLIPEDYVPDVHLRLVLYKRIASTTSREELDEMKAEMIDRFGPMPEYAQSLFRATRLKLRAAELGIRKIDAGASSGYFIFEESNKIDPKRVLKLIQGKPKEYRLDGPLKLRFTHDARSDEKLFTRVEQLVELLI